eukprot:scaffold50919_cov84-Phaeocystis_antarctica.AAC.1
MVDIRPVQGRRWRLCTGLARPPYFYICGIPVRQGARAAHSGTSRSVVTRVDTQSDCGYSA